MNFKPNSKQGYTTVCLVAKEITVINCQNYRKQTLCITILLYKPSTVFNRQNSMKQTLCFNISPPPLCKPSNVINRQNYKKQTLCFNILHPLLSKPSTVKTKEKKFFVLTFSSIECKLLSIVQTTVNRFEIFFQMKLFFQHSPPSSMQTHNSH